MKRASAPAQTYDYRTYLGELARHGSKTALIDAVTDEQLTYDQLVELSWQAARLFKSLEIKAGERVLIIGVRGLDWAPIFFGTQLAGVIAVPVDTRASAALLAAVIDATQPSLVIRGGGFQVRSAAKTLTDADFLNRARRQAKTGAFKPAAPNSVSQILLSSGTWSQPKGVTLRQSNVLQNMLAADRVYRLRPDEVLLSILPLSHAYEQMCGLHIPLRSGCRVVYLDEIQGEKIKAAIKKYAISLIVAVPRILEMFQKGILAKLPPARRPKIVKLAHLLRFKPVFARRLFFRKVHQGLGPSLRTLVVGGAALTEETDRFFQGLGYKVLVGYGLSETAPIISISTRQHGRRIGDVGRILDNIEAQTNPSGELLVRGPSVFAGYWPARRSPRTWFNTGDLAELNGREIRLIGRRKDMIAFPTGDKVMSEEVEVLIAQNLPAIEEVIVMPALDKKGLAQGLLIAYKAAGSVKGAAVENLLAERLPKSVRVLGVRNIHPDLLQRTHTLKLARQKNYDSLRSLFKS